MTRTVIQLRCTEAQKEAWFAAAGGGRQFSEWARTLLDEGATGSSRKPVIDFLDALIHFANRAKGMAA